MAMQDETNATANAKPDGGRSTGLYPRVYTAMAILAAVFALAAWGFPGAGYSRLQLAALSVLILVVIVLLSAIGHIRRRRRRLVAEDDSTAARSFREWARGDFATSAGFIKANLAAIEILLPIVAVVVGLTALAIIRDIVVS
jgi:uncharacterized membrane protein